MKEKESRDVALRCKRGRGKTEWEMQQRRNE